MSLPRPTGLKQPSRIGRPSGLPAPSSTARPKTPQPGSKASSPEPPSDDGSGSVINTDDFKIGDRVWVSGTKPGMIAFIGETQFAPGDWAGIVLDDPVGKNDGSVMGVRYFQCEAKRGVFSRLSKLYHTQQSPRDIPPSNGTTPRPSSRLGLSSSKHLSTSSSSLSKGPVTPTAGVAVPAASTGTTPMRLPGTMPGGAKVGDRVVVSGSKAGVLRYIGETDFAKGVWAGVELEEPMGKNDGAVAGKRYFDCKPLHGLFAPVHKIQRAGGSATSTPSPHSRPLMSTSLRSSRERSGSQESVSSISSTASSVSRSRVRLGVNALATQQGTKAGQRPSTLNLSATTTALQKALKEKEEHIEQLLRERDLERSEVARAAAHVDEAEGQLSSMKSEQERVRQETEDTLATLRTRVTQLEGERQELSAFLEEEKRKVEDLQFQLEEEALKEEGEGKTAVDDDQVRDLEQLLRKEKERADALASDLHQLQLRVESQQKATSEAEEAQVAYLDQIEELTYKLTQAETKCKAFENSRVEDGAKTSAVSIELSEKAARVKELEDQLTAQRKEMNTLAQKLEDVREELSANQEKRKKQDEHIQELTNKMNQVQTDHKTVMDQLRNANSNSADLQRQLDASETKAEEIASDRAKLEEQLQELVRNSGDSSSQLASVNEQLSDKTRKVEDLQSALSSSSQNLAKAQEAYQELQQQRERDLAGLREDHEAKVGGLTQEMDDLQASVSRYQAKINQLSESHDTERRETEERRAKEVEEAGRELAGLKEQLTASQDQAQALRGMLDRAGEEKEEIQHIKNQVEKQLKRMETEKAGVSTELIQARLEVTRLQEQLTSGQGNQAGLEEERDNLRRELDAAVKARSQLETTSKKKEEEAKERREEVQREMEREKEKVKGEMEGLERELERHKVTEAQLREQLERSHAESRAQTEELMQKSQSETELISQQLASVELELSESHRSVQARDDQLTAVRGELAELKDIVHHRDMLLKEKAEVMKEKEASEERCRQFIKDMEKGLQKADQLQSEVSSLHATEGALRRENSTLTDQLAKVQEQLARAQVDIAPAVSAPVSGLDAGAGDSGQVDFLNSVIVDLQSKNAELKERLAVMEDSGIHTNGADSDILLEAPVPSSRAPPRLFCDICDVFDLHDTEDCPKQAMSDSPPPSRHHGDRHNTRPYCDICEAFGHWTDTCDDEQTF